MALKDELIKLGYEKPELRDHLRPILATLDKKGGRTFREGDRVEVVGLSGIDSGKQGVVVSRREVKTNGRGVPTNIAGAYQPVDWNKEVAVRLDDGSLITMFKNRLDKVAHSGRSASLHTPSGTWGAANTPDLAALSWFGYAVAPAGMRSKAEKMERAEDITLREVLRHTDRQTDDVTIEYLKRNFEEVRSRYLTVEERRASVTASNWYERSAGRGDMVLVECGAGHRWEVPDDETPQAHSTVFQHSCPECGHRAKYVV